MAKVTYYPNTGLARLSATRLGIVVTITDLNWRVDVRQTLSALGYYKISEWEPSGQNYVAEFKNASINSAYSVNTKRHLHRVR